MIALSAFAFLLVTQAPYRVVRMLPPWYPGEHDNSDLGSLLIARLTVPFKDGVATYDRFQNKRITITISSDRLTKKVTPVVTNGFLLKDSKGKLIAAEIFEERDLNVLTSCMRDGKAVQVKTTYWVQPDGPKVDWVKGSLPLPTKPVFWSISESLAFDPGTFDPGRSYTILYWPNTQLLPTYHDCTISRSRGTEPKPWERVGFRWVSSDGKPFICVNDEWLSDWTDWIDLDPQGRLTRYANDLFLYYWIWPTTVPEAEAKAFADQALAAYMDRKKEFEALVSPSG